MPKRSTLRLTKRTVDALVVETKDTLFRDRDLAGFGVRVHATGRKCHVVQSRGPAGAEAGLEAIPGERAFLRRRLLGCIARATHFMRPGRA